MFQILKKKSKDFGIRSHLTISYFRLTMFIIDMHYYIIIIILYYVNLFYRVFLYYLMVLYQIYYEMYSRYLSHLKKIFIISKKQSMFISYRLFDLVVSL